MNKLEVMARFFNDSKSYMNYPNNKLRFWLGLPRATIRFLWFSRHDKFWKE